MDFGFTINRNENDITAGIGSNIIKLITIAIESNSIESFNEIDGFCNRILLKSIENKNIYHFKEYLEIVIGYYIISYQTNKNKGLDSKIHQFCADRSARRIRELFLLINHIFNKSNLENKKTYNFFKLSAFTAFGQLLFEQVKRRDIIWFKHTLNQIENIFLGETLEMSEFSMISRNPSNIDKVKLDNYIEDIQINIYTKNTILGIRYWIYYLYENKQISFEELTQFTNLTNQFKKKSLNINLWEMELLFNKLNSGQFNQYFNWQGWDYKTHSEGKFHTLPSVFDWIFTGCIIDSIKQGQILNSLSFDLNIIESDSNPQNITLLIHTLKKQLNKIISERALWSDFFNKNDFDNTVDFIRKQLNLLSSQSEIKSLKRISLENLNRTKVNNFKQNFYNKWNESKSIHKIFDFFDKKIKHKEEIQKLKRVGKIIFFDEGKTFFIDDTNFLDTAHIIENLATQLSEWEDELFFQTILKDRTEIVYPSISSGLQQAIIKIKDKKNSPSIIFIDSTILLRDLENDKKWNTKKTLAFSHGTYDSIPVYFINTSLMQNRFIVADFKKAFTMFYHNTEEGFNNDELKIEVKEVSDVAAQKKLNNEPQKWKYINGHEIPNEDALIYIKTSVFIDFEVMESYEINDNNAFEIGLIDHKLKHLDINI